jgi:hypothetical protein
MTYKAYCLECLEKVKHMVERVASESALRTDGVYVDGCHISHFLREDQWEVNIGEVFGYVDLCSNKISYDTEGIKGLRAEFGSYEEVRDAILHAPDELIENSPYAEVITGA